MRQIELVFTNGKLLSLSGNTVVTVGSEHVQVNEISLFLGIIHNMWYFCNVILKKDKFSFFRFYVCISNVSNSKHSIEVKLIHMSSFLSGV